MVMWATGARAFERERGMTPVRCAAVLGAILCLSVSTVPSAHAAVRKVPLIEAVKAGGAAQVAPLLAKKVDVNESEPDGTTALHWAADAGDSKTVDALLRAG